MFSDLFYPQVQHRTVERCVCRTYTAARKRPSHPCEFFNVQTHQQRHQRIYEVQEMQN